MRGPYRMSGRSASLLSLIAKIVCGALGRPRRTSIPAGKIDDVYDVMGDHVGYEYDGRIYSYDKLVKELFYGR